MCLGVYADVLSASMRCNVISVYIHIYIYIYIRTYLKILLGFFKQIEKTLWGDFEKTNSGVLYVENMISSYNGEYKYSI